MYIPDPAFVRRLKSHDSALKVRWLSNRWPQKGQRERWAIYREVFQRGRISPWEVIIMLVTDSQGGYAPLSETVLDSLRRGDTWKRGVKTVMNELAEKQENEQISDDVTSKSESVAMAEDMRSAAIKDADNLGSLNIPKEDAVAMIENDLAQRGTTYEEVMS